MELDINRDLFNKLYWHVTEALQNEEIRYIFIYGGSSSSKSYTVGQAIILECLLKHAESTMILRKFGVDIRDSVYSDFKHMLNDYNLLSVVDPQINLMECKNGARIRFRGLDDPEKIKGLSNFKRVFLEEVSQFDHADLKQVRKRLRGKAGQQIVCVWNPIDENHWIKKKVIDTFDWIDQPHDLDANSFIKKSKEGNAILIKTTYLDNYWITGHPTKPDVGFFDKHTVDDFNADKISDYNYYRIYALGEYGMLTTGAEIYKNFDPEKHTSRNRVFTDRKLWLSFDENVLPYVSLTVWQGDSETKHLRQMAEIAAAPPRNTLKDLINMFVKRFPNRNIPLVITGDRTSIKADVKLEKNQNFFKMVEAQLIDEGYSIERRLPSKNPSVINRIAFINEIFSGTGRAGGCKVTLHEDAVKTVADVKYCPEDADGTKLKKKEKNKETGQSYEIWGHMSDTMDYAVIEFFKDDYLDFVNGGRKNLVKTYRKPLRSY